MVRMIILRRVSNNERGSELAEHLNQFESCWRNIEKTPIGDISEKQSGTKQSRAGDHLPAAFRLQIGDACLWLAFVALAQHTDGNRRAFGFRSRERAGANQFGIVRVRDHGHNPVPAEIESHGRK